MHNEHFIDGKWIDCKSAIPFEEIKSLEKKQKEDEKGTGSAGEDQVGVGASMRSS